MGCCVSTSTNSPSPSKSPNHIPNPSLTITKSPPRIPEEETVVKEVLNLNYSKTEFDKNTVLEKPNSIIMALSEEKLQEDSSESFSVPVEDKGTENVKNEMKQGRSEPSPGRVRPRNQNERMRSENLCDRSEPSPGRIRPGNQNGSTRRENFGDKSDPSPGRVRPGNQNGTRRENLGDSSGRMVRAPSWIGSESGGDLGLLKPGLGRSPSPNTRGKAPSRVGSELGDRVHLSEGKEGGKMIERNDHRQVESLENPLMSLECFIFL